MEKWRGELIIIQRQIKELYMRLTASKRAITQRTILKWLSSLTCEIIWHQYYYFEDNDQLRESLVTLLNNMKITM
jgi:hypothetical protein